MANSQPPAAESRRSVDTDHSGQPIRTYGRRWYIALLFSAISCTRGIVWNTFGPIPVAAQAAFPSWDDTTISMISNMGSITFLVFVAPYCWVLSRFGLRPAVLLMSFFIALGTTLRSSTSEEIAFTATVYTCAILGGIAGIMSMVAPPYLSATWFPPQQRTTATALMLMSGELGVALSFVIGPQMVRLPGGATPHTDPDGVRSNIMFLMDVDTGVAALLFLVVLLYFPSRPRRPPSVSAASPPEPGSFWRRLRQVARAPDTPFIMLALAVPGGLLVAYFAVLDISMAPLGVTKEQAGWISFWACICSCVFAVLVARLTDMFRGHVRVTLLVLMLTGAACCAWLLAIIAGWQAFSLPCLYSAALSTLALTCSTAPLLLEYAAELTYPVTADIIGMVMGVSLSIVSGAVLLLFILQPLGEDTLWMNYAVFVALLLGVMMILKTKEVYRRTAADRGLDVSEDAAEPAEANREPKENEETDGVYVIEVHDFESEATSL